MGESVIEDEIGTHIITNTGVTISTSEKKYGESSVNITTDNYIECSNNDDWDILSTIQYIIDFWDAFEFTNENLYLYYRVIVTSHWIGNSGNQRHIDEIEMMEAIYE